MTLIPERLQILKMVEDRTVSVSEGVELLRAVGEDAGIYAQSPSETSHNTTAPRWLHIRITDMNSGDNKVNVNIPLGLVKVGVKMGAQLAPDVDGVSNEDILTAIRAGKQGKIVAVADDKRGEYVEIYVE